MDLTAWLRGRAAPRPLLVSVPGAAAVRFAVERDLRERGWELALGPAEADMLVVCGAPGPDLVDPVERVWMSLASPRARADIDNAGSVDAALDRARALLDDPDAQSADRSARVALAGSGAAAVQDDIDGHDDQAGGHDMGGHDMGGHDMGGHDMGMDMGLVAGLPMAQRAPDRDGIALDQLHVALGPILPDWPAGLIVRLTLQGDLVQTAEVDMVGRAGASAAPSPTPTRATALDSLGRLLTVCGWGTAARTARRLRDDVLAGAVDTAEIGRFVRRVRRSTSLRWATDGLGRLDDTDPALVGDATQRWRNWLDEIEGAGDANSSGSVDRARTAVRVLPGLLEGRELAGVRVVVASLDPDLDLLAPARDRGVPP